MDRPAKMNAALREAFDTYAADPEMRFRAVTGAGDRAFRAGPPSSAAYGRARPLPGHALPEWLRLARDNGKRWTACGGGRTIPRSKVRKGKHGHRARTSQGSTASR